MSGGDDRRRDLRAAVRPFRSAAAALGRLPTGLGGLLAGEEALAWLTPRLPGVDASPFAPLAGVSSAAGEEEPGGGGAGLSPRAAPTAPPVRPAPRAPAGRDAAPRAPGADGGPAPLRPRAEGNPLSTRGASPQPPSPERPAFPLRREPRDRGSRPAEAGRAGPKEIPPPLSSAPGAGLVEEPAPAVVHRLRRPVAPAGGAAPRRGEPPPAPDRAPRRTVGAVPPAAPVPDASVASLTRPRLASSAPPEVSGEGAAPPAGMELLDTLAEGALAVRATVAPSIAANGAASGVEASPVHSAAGPAPSPAAVPLPGSPADPWSGTGPGLSALHRNGSAPLPAPEEAEAPPSLAAVDADVLAALVNDALVEQARRHGVDLS